MAKRREPKFPGVATGTHILVVLHEGCEVMARLEPHVKKLPEEMQMEMIMNGQRVSAYLVLDKPTERELLPIYHVRRATPKK